MQKQQQQSNNKIKIRNAVVEWSENEQLGFAVGATGRVEC